MSTSQEATGYTYEELEKLPKTALVRMHRANGGLMRHEDYLAWTAEELIEACLEDYEALHEARKGRKTAR